MGDIRITAIPRSPDVAPPRFGVEAAAEALHFHETLPGYEKTRLVSLDGAAASLGLAGFFVKDESSRFGLNAFKGLGGSFAMHALAQGKSGLRFITATDGNHGRGVAWAARLMGHEARVLLPRGSAQERLRNILALGAGAEITELSYDDTVRLAAQLAEKEGYILIQDTSWDGYEEIPALIMQGYTTMGAEISEQLCGRVPTHVFLQAGVGAMAGAMSSFFASLWGERRPVTVTVEPEGADCIYRTAKAADGKLHFCGEDMATIMAGLCCGEPCDIGWRELSRFADFAVTVPDSIAVSGMRAYAREGIVSGESGAVTGGLVYALMTAPENAGIRSMLGLGADSTVLCISTEGDTDKESYAAAVYDA